MPKRGYNIKNKEKMQNDVVTEHASKTKTKGKKRQRKAGNKKEKITISACQENQGSKGASEMSQCKEGEEISISQDCGMFDPPNDLVIDEQDDISWSQCDCCDSWFHGTCLELFHVNTDTWLCYNCYERW